MSAQGGKTHRARSSHAGLQSSGGVGPSGMRRSRERARTLPGEGNRTPLTHPPPSPFVAHQSDHGLPATLTTTRGNRNPAAAARGKRARDPGPKRLGYHGRAIDCGSGDWLRQGSKGGRRGRSRARQNRRDGTAGNSKPLTGDERWRSVAGGSVRSAWAPHCNFGSPGLNAHAFGLPPLRASRIAPFRAFVVNRDWPAVSDPLTEYIIDCCG